MEILLRSDWLKSGTYEGIPHVVLEDDKLTGNDKILFLTLLSFLHEGEETCRPFIKTILKRCGMTKKQYKLAAINLEKRGWLERSCRSLTSNEFRLKLPEDRSLSVPISVPGGTYASPSEDLRQSLEGPTPVPGGPVKGTPSGEHLPGTLSGEQGRPSAVDNIVSLFKDYWTKAGLNHLENISDSTLGKLIKPVLKSDPDFKDRIKPLCEKVSAGKFLKTLSISTILKRSKDNHELFNYEIILDGQWDDHKGSRSTFDPNRGMITQEQLRAELGSQAPPEAERVDGETWLNDLSE